ncbi:MAG: hypothetical protein R6V52_11940, partial [Bacteroidales bacterium]
LFDFFLFVPQIQDMDFKQLFFQICIYYQCSRRHRHQIAKKIEIWVNRYILLQHLSIVFSFLSFLPQKKETKKVTAAPSFSANRATATTASVISSFLRAQKLLSNPACLPVKAGVSAGRLPRFATKNSLMR